MNQAALKNALKYIPETGHFRWAVGSSRRAAGEIAGSVDRKGHRRIRIGGKKHSAHRLAWLWQYGEWPAGQVDHVNHNPDDNRIENLRVVSNQENHKNRKRPLQNRGIAGVYWKARDQKWSAEIKSAGKTKSLGQYNSYFDACCARKAAEMKYGFHENHYQN